MEQELARDPKAVLAEVLERDGTEYTATEVRQRNLADADHLGPAARDLAGRDPGAA